jgi:hypothetical protein
MRYEKQKVDAVHTYVIHASPARCVSLALVGAAAQDDSLLQLMYLQPPHPVTANHKLGRLSRRGM